MHQEHPHTTHELPPSPNLPLPHPVALSTVASPRRPRLASPEHLGAPPPSPTTPRVLLEHRRCSCSHRLYLNPTRGPRPRFIPTAGRRSPPRARSGASPTASRPPTGSPMSRQPILAKAIASARPHRRRQPPLQTGRKLLCSALFSSLHASFSVTELWDPPVRHHPKPPLFGLRG